ncbi:MAG: hypothetical protein RKO68_02160 [Candidatus Accumulibacter sp.]|nr:hypothetical protein [Accumulibacter sp.]
MEKNQLPAALSMTANPSIRRDLDNYLDAIAEATAIFRDAVDSYLRAGPDGVCWRQAKQIDDHLRAVDDLQQKIETGARAHWLIGTLVSDMDAPLAGVSRLLKEMKRQITGFAIESGFSTPGRRVPLDLLPEMQTLTRTVCATVDALIAKYRPSAGWWTGETSTERPRVAWYENQADRCSTALLKKIFADGRLADDSKLPLAQLVEEIDRVADQAQGIDRQIKRGNE